jgi:hypothetical protein
MCLAVYETPDTDHRGWDCHCRTLKNVDRKSSSFFVIGIDLAGRPLELHGLGELLPATLTDRFVGALVVVPASRFRWIVRAAEGAS